MKWIAVLAIVACTLMASLYATAAPVTRAPTNHELAAQIASLRTQVRVLKADVTWLSSGVKSLDNCQLRTLWISYQFLYLSVASGQTTMLGQPTKRPDCA
jgi:hypothetical protein